MLTSQVLSPSTVGLLPEFTVVLYYNRYLGCTLDLPGTTLHAARITVLRRHENMGPDAAQGDGEVLARDLKPMAAYAIFLSENAKIR